MDKTIRRVADVEQQQEENYRYWQSRPIGERLLTVVELSESAYAFAAAFKGASKDVDRRLQGPPSPAKCERG